ncbi:DUF2314 domain-containing protein [Erythrobacter sp. JK5]|uniref:DUF2314 domain-containing protein n=1 Tax=Erythrobacter sp. JK5 TaxID=2829500 RepID=UPI001BA879C9|nr:DUF2314 domain-containing protein [Erythrobacter sp. JK5]QUL37021.1 DUF2314 domain-containing protein [Erythrobacter sp. JK5]
MPRPLLLALSIALAATPLAPTLAQDASEPDPIVEVDQTDAAMNAAKDEARETLDQWLAVLADPPEGASDILFKFPLGGWEHIWVGNVARDGDTLTGNLANAPHSEGYAYGDPVRVPLTQVSDWTWRDATGYVHGHRTTRVLFDQLDPETVEAIKRDFGWE